MKLLHFFAIKDPDGTDVSLASLKGKIVVVYFRAAWCRLCTPSFPGIKKAVEKYMYNPGVKFVFIDTRENETKDKVKMMLAITFQRMLILFLFNGLR